MIIIIFESHATTLDNEAHLASGWNDVELSPIGMEQAKQLGQRRENEEFEAIFCSDLQRSFKTAEIAFSNKFPIIKDSRLRECDYGDLTKHPSAEVDPLKPKHIKIAFPNGESYEQSTKKMELFLKEIAKKYQGKKIMIIGHRATQYALENLINKVPLEKIIPVPWKWQPGWEYRLEN